MKKKLSLTSGFNQACFHTIVTHVPHAIFWKDTNSIYLGCNQSFALSAGLREVIEVIGKTDFDLPWYKFAADKYRLEDKGVIESRQPIIDKEVYLLKMDGTESIISISKVPLFEQNKVIGILGIYTDITQRKRNEDTLREAKEKAELADQAKTEFIHNMEHDIRTPFNGIYGMATILESRETDALKKEYLQDIINSSKQLLDYSNSILEFARLGYGAMPLIAKKLDIYKLFKNIIEIEQPPAKIKDIDLSLEIDEKIPNILVGDPYRLQRIFINLISNAIKFTTQGHVKLLIKSLPKQSPKEIILEINVQDTGIGIPKNKQDFIYEKFTRLTASNQGIYLGSGLGLKVVKQLITDLEGEIDLISEEGKGTNFICTIPFTVPLVDKIFNEE